MSFWRTCFTVSQVCIHSRVSYTANQTGRRHCLRVTRWCLNLTSNSTCEIMVFRQFRSEYQLMYRTERQSVSLCVRTQVDTATIIPWLRCQRTGIVCIGTCCLCIHVNLTPIVELCLILVFTEQLVFQLELRNNSVIADFLPRQIRYCHRVSPTSVIICNQVAQIIRCITVNRSCQSTSGWTYRIHLEVFACIIIRVSCGIIFPTVHCHIRHCVICLG